VSNRTKAGAARQFASNACQQELFWQYFSAKEAKLQKTGGESMDWEPGRADHSIDRATANLQLAENLDPNLVDELVVATRKAIAPLQITHRFDVPEPIELPAPQSGVINFSPLNMAGQRRVVFQRKEPDTDVILEEVSVGAKRLAFATQHYKRWTDFYATISTVIDALSPIFPVADAIKLVKLEYLDRFQSTTSSADFFEVLSKDSSFLAQAAKGQGSSFHVHSGWFEFPKPEVRKLINVNVDAFDVDFPPVPDSKRKITIMSMEQYEALRGLLDKPLERLNSLHSDLISLFSSIITKDAAARIALTGKTT
jgi:uncharacterized protein (TIGR04255 family)